jgi:hypothetical protein
MRRFLALSFLSLAAMAAAVPPAEAQNGRRGDALILNVRPRSWLNPGNVIPVGAQVNPASPLGQTVSYMVLPPWQNMRDRFGEGVLPDPIGGPFIGARNPIGPVNFVAPDFLR